MLEQIGYLRVDDKDGTKDYTISEKGRKCVAAQTGYSVRMRGPKPRWLNPEKLDDIIATRRQFEKLTELLKDKARTADTEKLGRIREVLSHACDEISKD